eukprot:scaffold6316_cov17-Tisochrysis_lutea.AAC.1
MLAMQTVSTSLSQGNNMLQARMEADVSFSCTLHCNSGGSLPVGAAKATQHIYVKVACLNARSAHGQERRRLQHLQEHALDSL